MEIKKVIGIYKITNTISNKVYIGQSTNIQSRKQYHRSALDGNRHINNHLQSAWKKYGEDNFTFIIIEECSIDTIDERERYWILFYDSTNGVKGYNLESGGNSQKTLSKESILKMSNARKASDKIRGENCYTSKITNLQAEQVKVLYSQGVKRKEINLITGVNIGTICSIRNLQSWVQVLPELNDKMNPMKNLPKKRIMRGKTPRKGFTDEQVIKIRKMLEIGISGAEIARTFGIRRNLIYDIKIGKTYKIIA